MGWRQIHQKTGIKVNGGTVSACRWQPAIHNRFKLKTHQKHPDEGLFSHKIPAHTVGLLQRFLFQPLFIMIWFPDFHPFKLSYFSSAPVRAYPSTSYTMDVLSVILHIHHFFPPPFQTWHPALPLLQNHWKAA